MGNHFKKTGHELKIYSDIEAMMPIVITIDEELTLDPGNFKTHAEYQAALDKLVPPETEEAAAGDAAHMALQDTGK
jgi:hypothetical protein